MNIHLFIIYLLIKPGELPQHFYVHSRFDIFELAYDDVSFSVHIVQALLSLDV
jgi:hypothetical protein